MSVRTRIQAYFGFYFITITCCRWLNLFEISNCYNAAYKWFDSLKARGHYIAGYVLMPNHLHALIAFRHTEGQSINRIIGTGKRFMAYDIVKSLENGGNHLILKQLRSFVNRTEKRIGKLHEVFEPSFDWKECSSPKFIEQKLNYIHENPCRGKWSLADQPWNYIHSSARFYYCGDHSAYPVDNYATLQDLDLSKH
jgi:REP element-mobilizing transposase RayT